METNNRRKTIKFKELIETVTKEQFENFYFLHSKEETMIYFRIGSTVFYKFIKYHSIVKPQEMINRVREMTNIEKYSVSNTFQLVDRVKEGYIKCDGSLENHYKKTVDIQKRHAHELGYNSLAQTPEAQEKRKKTNLYKYGNLNGYNDKKSKETKLDRYGNENYNNIEKIKKTNIERYGCEFNFGSDDYKINGRGTYHEKLKNDIEFKKSVIEKRANTCIERYGKDYYVNQVKLMASKVASHNNSTVNKEVKAYLTSLGLVFESEFQLENFIYDFKLGNYLIEIDPYATHNSTWGIFNNNAKDKEYHRKKTLNAVKHGYECVHIFDWVNLDDILWSIMNHKINIYDTGIIHQHYYNVKTHKLSDIETPNTVTIWDDGFNVAMEE